MQRTIVGSSRQPSTSLPVRRGSLATATRTRRMCPRWSMELKCASPKRGRSTEPCARRTASASARSRSLGPFPPILAVPMTVSHQQKNSTNGSNNGQPRLRDQLCLLIRQHSLDPTLVKAYAADFCGTPSLKEANRELVQSFVAHLAACAKENRDMLICRLNSYAQPVEAKP